jgi:glycosyltransferase involved in cell wall biosynthesis
MKIGVVVDNELNNDIRVLREIGMLKAHGHEIFVLCFGFGSDYSLPVEGITVTRIRMSRKYKNILFFLLNTLPAYEWIWALKIRKFILVNGIEALHVHDLYMSRSAHIGIRKSGKNIPLVLDLHENYPFTVMTYNWTKGVLRSFISKPAKWKEKEKEYLGYAERLIVLSSDFRDQLLGRYPELTMERFSVLPNVPDLARIEGKNWSSPGKLFPGDEPVLFYYGVIAERRGIFDTLDVFTDLMNDKFPLNFLLIGPVDKKDRQLFLDRIGSELFRDHTRYIPWIDSSELPVYLENTDICIAPFHKNPQHESGVANKIYDYMLGGKPLIVSDCKPQQQLVEKHNCGIVFKDPESMKKAIIRLAVDPALRITMGNNGRKAVLEEYNVNVVRDNLLAIYETMSTMQIKPDEE